MRKRLPRRVPAVLAALLLLGCGVGLFVTYRVNRPLPAFAVTLDPLQVPAAQAVPFDWAASGAAIIGQADGKVLGSGPGANERHPTASTIKLLTILTVLKKYPLAPGEQGPTLTMTDADAALYDAYVAKGGSAVRVETGETMTEYQALEAMLLPSANNIADSLAIWAFGSLAGYRTQAALMLSSLGMSATVLGPDASGFSADTVSTAADLYTLGRAAYADPVIAEIAAKKTATLPLVGPVGSTDDALGDDGINGLKTGTGDVGVENFIFSAEHTFANGDTGAFVGVVLAAPSTSARFSEAQSLLTTAYGHYRTVTVVHKGQPVGRVEGAWGQGADVVAGTDLSAFVWAGDRLQSVVTPSAVPPSRKGSVAATVSLGTQSVPLVLAGGVPPPSLLWRVTH